MGWWGLRWCEVTHQGAAGRGVTRGMLVVCVLKWVRCTLECIDGDLVQSLGLRAGFAAFSWMVTWCTYDRIEA